MVVWNTVIDPFIIPFKRKSWNYDTDIRQFYNLFAIPINKSQDILIPN